MSARGYTITPDVVLVTEQCCSCGITFAMPREFQQQCLNHPGIRVGKGFFCPNGHQQWYTGKTEADKQRERADRAERIAGAANTRAQAWRDQAEAAERSARAYRGHLTRMRNKVAAGVCPVATCRRNFTNVREHIATEHPDWAHDHPEALR